VTNAIFGMFKSADGTFNAVGDLIVHSEFLALQVA
jgi:hypothetical protein